MAKPMKRGEIGCFLSHYSIWKKSLQQDSFVCFVGWTVNDGSMEYVHWCYIGNRLLDSERADDRLSNNSRIDHWLSVTVVQSGDEVVMVLEDDVRFEAFFRQKVEALLDELKSLALDWDLVYEVFRKDRDQMATGKERGGGVLLAVHRRVSAVLMTHPLIVDDLDLLLVRLTLPLPQGTVLYDYEQCENAFIKPHRFKSPKRLSSMYLGRKRLQEQDEVFVPGSKMLVRPNYSYWTLGYLLSQSGARKLLAADPLNSLLPVDEYIPILYDRHTEEKWKANFPVRNLQAFSAEPLLIYPARYLHEEGYVSDTEDSPQVSLPRDDL
ncbi:hypothetical protein J6590_056046 [Homalodisca vitripennis]|nr:hypothetical protein J6590_056046 [Homalodisca vitripennis]